MDKRLVNILEHQLQESDASLFESHEQVERNYRYYALQPLGNEQTGYSHYVSPDVHDYVESKKALFKETFLSNRQTVKFMATGATPPGEAEAKTAYAQRVLDANKKSRLFPEFWHDAFLAKMGVTLIEWVEDTDIVEMQVERATEQQVMQQASQQGTVLGLDAEQTTIEQVPVMGPQGPQAQVLMTGTVSVEIDASRIEITLCEPERYFRDPLAAHLDDAMWATYQDEVPRGTLKRRGYDEDLVDRLDSNYRWQRGDVDYARKQHDQSYTTGQGQARHDDQETVTFFKTWTWINLADADLELDGDYPDEIRLYEIHWANGEILEWADGTPAIREVGEMPFFEWSELPISHAATGMCGADVVAHSQKTNSTLKRAIIDNANIVNNTRWEAREQDLLNPRDLLDNTIGGVIFSDTGNAVRALDAPMVSPVTFQTLAMIQQDTEARSGMSSLAKGMNTDALRYQNAADMVERLTNSAKTRPMQSARDWALNWLIPVCQHICKLGMRYDKTQDQIESGGRMIPVIPAQWRADCLDMDIAVALTPDEGADHAQKLMVMHQTLSMDPQLSQLYGLKERHALMDDVFDAMGVGDTQRYLMRPDSPEFAQAQQQMQQQQQMQMQQQQQMFAQQQANFREQLDQKWAEINNKIMDTMQDNEREDEKSDWTMYKEGEELEIERDQKRAANIG